MSVRKETIATEDGKMQRIKKLPERLKTIAGFIGPGASVIDVGTDHGYLPVYLAQTESARRIIASDISAGSLGAARRAAEKYGLSDRIEFIVAPGLTGVSEADVDTIVIAGMGGETIAGILEASPWAVNCRRIILQPQTKIEELRCWLRENGYAIQEEKQARDRGRDYTVLFVKN